ncbi:MAG: B12-binding domain-containing radical SAM protein [Magnetococcales bacterium]|nr:B12-binding domain-containing radical SAM protein [Magnetococcales bacterium]
MAAVLRQRGFRPVLLDFQLDQALLVSQTTALHPVLVGVSIIFQIYLPRFASLTQALRQGGISCPIVAGGHFPSLEYAFVLENVPSLTAVVRFEGEETLPLLTDRLIRGLPWQDLDGVAYRRDNKPYSNPPRALIADLDSLPYPERPFSLDRLLGINMAPILASRGCPQNCSFCSIRSFYKGAPGKAVRRRHPERVVEEMVYLQNHRKVAIFLFQDDDFIPAGNHGKQWLQQFLNELHRQGLVGKILWKISVRADQIQAELLADMRKAGLFFVYLGLESGNEQGLLTLNKGLSVSDNLQAVATLKRLELPFAYGFMLIDPSSTLESVRENVGFLRKIIGDGSALVNFSRMVPYAGTPIAKTLAASGRLLGSPLCPDYTLQDDRLAPFFQSMFNIIELWSTDPHSFYKQMNNIINESIVLNRFCNECKNMPSYLQDVKNCALIVNNIIFEYVEDLCNYYDDNRFSGKTFPPLPAKKISRQVDKLIKMRNNYVLKNQKKILSRIDSLLPL